MADSLKDQTVKGIGWSFIERFSIQGVNFIIQLVLARILVPEDYGIIAMLAIFLQIAQVFVDSGFANALIQKKKCTDEDYSTVFFYNLVISVLLYGGLWLTAPLISEFYSIPLLTNVTRIIALSLIINALSIVQKTILVKKIDFHNQTKVSFTSAFLSGAIGISMAYTGWGVWSLVAQTIANGILQFFLFTIIVRWYPILSFSRESFKELFGFGSKLLVSQLIHAIYSNLYQIVIGKKYNATDLGFYSRAEQFAFFPSSNIGSVINRVVYPSLSKIQDDDIRLINVYRKIIKFASYIIFPMMFGLLALSAPVIKVILTDKWEGTIILLQILCLAWMIDHLSMLNLNVLYVKGRSDLVLRLEVVKKTIAIAILFISLNFGIVIMCWGRVVYGIIAFYINSLYTNKLLGLSFSRQVADVLPYYISSAIMMVIVYGSGLFISSQLIKLIVGLLVGAISYIAISLFFHREIVDEIKNYYNRYKYSSRA